MDTRASIERSFSQASPGYDDHAAVQRRIGIDLIRRLRDAQLLSAFSSRDTSDQNGGYGDSDQVFLDAGCGTGHFLEALFALSGSARGVRCIAMDLSAGMLSTLQARHQSATILPLRGDLAALPLASDCVNLIFSNLAMQWLDDPTTWLTEAVRVLKPGGWLAATNLTAGTLDEISLAWSEVDHARHVNRFWSVEALEACVGSALAGSQIDTHRFTEYFASPLEAMRSVKGVGAHTITSGVRTQLTSPGLLKRALAAYGTLKTTEGIPLSYNAAFILYRKPT